MTARPAPVKSVHVTIADAPHGEINGTIDMPAEPTGAVALVAHCFTCDHKAVGAARISKALAHKGITSVRCTFNDLTLSHNVDDLVAIANWLESEHGSAPQLLVGHSLGGVAVLRAAARIPSVEAVATVGTPFDPRHALASVPDLTAKFAENDAPDELDVTLAGRPVHISREMIEDLNASDPQSDLHSFGESQANLLVAHSPFDQTVPFAQALSFFDAALQPASFFSIPEADHLLTRRGSGQRVGDLIAEWARPLLSLR